jgi:uncharacterized damage-inducible protein DinB
MSKTYKYFSIALITLVLINPILAHSGDHHEKSDAEYDPFIELMLGQVAFMEGRLTSLAEAIPADKYSWRPAEGVRSTGEHFAHMIGASYGIPSMMGAEMPGHITMEIEKTLTGKEEIVKTLKESFAAVTKFLKHYDTANYEEIVKTPFGEYSQRTMILIINNHYHEHLGSLIAYARSNGVTPPWSEKKEETK